MPRLIDLDSAVSVADANLFVVSQGGVARKATRSQILSTALLLANNLSDLNDATASRGNLGLGEIATLDVGTGLEIDGSSLRVDTTAMLALTGGQLTGHIRFTRNFGVSAAGTVQGDATAITAQMAVVTTVASGAGVILPATGPVWIRNNGANTLKIYPPVGDNINALSANTAATLTVGGSVIIETDNGTQWYTF